jgi:hypothetical protein
MIASEEDKLSNVASGMYLHEWFRKEIDKFGG